MPASKWHSGGSRQRACCRTTTRGCTPDGVAHGIRSAQASAPTGYAPPPLLFPPEYFGSIPLSISFQCEGRSEGRFRRRREPIFFSVVHNSHIVEQRFLLSSTK